MIRANSPMQKEVSVYKSNLLNQDNSVKEVIFEKFFFKQLFENK